jgi:hypothetical protein
MPFQDRLLRPFSLYNLLYQDRLKGMPWICGLTKSPHYGDNPQAIP